MALSAPVERLNNGSTVDGTVFTTASFTPPASVLLLLFVTEGHATAAEEPTISGTLGLTWTKIAGQTTTAGVMRGTWWWSKTTASPPTGTLIFTHATLHSNCSWMLQSIAGANLTTPIKQFATPFQTTTTDNPGVTLGTAIVAGNMTMGANVWNRTFVLPPGTGYTEVSPGQGFTAPTVIGSVEYKLAGTTLVDWTTIDDIQKVLFGIEIAAGAGNAAPTANAGADLTAIEPYSTVTLDGTGADTDGTVSTLIWTQSGGSPSVTLSGSGSDPCTFTAPGTIAGTTLTFTLTATDNLGATGTDTMTVAVLPVTERAVVGGVEVPVQTIAVHS